VNEGTIGFILGIIGMVVIAPFAMRSFNQQRKKVSTRRRERKRNQ
jgi:H+/gluconate symporter-like permease